MISSSFGVENFGRIAFTMHHVMRRSKIFEAEYFLNALFGYLETHDDREQETRRCRAQLGSDIMVPKYHAFAMGIVPGYEKSKP